jgi:ABC-type oligopeptide transport system ATPase subunit
MAAIVRCVELRKEFPVRTGYPKTVKALNGVSLEIRKGETLGLVGESGSGKTTLGRIILGLLKQDAGNVELYTERPQVMFQDPYSSLDPKMRVADILAEGLFVQRTAYSVQRTGLDRRKKLEEALEMVKLPRSALAKYPHQFSGGERQRIAIARAVLSEPELIICDEPVSSLDVTIQVQILRLLKEVQARLSAAYLFISHDLHIVKFMSDRVAVMKDGRIVEEGAAAGIYSNPQHPYTRLLLSSILSLHPPK